MIHTIYLINSSLSARMESFSFAKLFSYQHVAEDCFLKHSDIYMQKLGRMKHKTGIKTAGRNINNLRYAYDTTLMADRDEELTAS